MNVNEPKPEIRTMRVTGPNLNAIAVWELRHIWICVRADQPIRFMAHSEQYFTLPKLAQLKRRGWDYQWLE